MKQGIDDKVWKDKLKIILKEIIRICETHDITYFLTGGSCLGAVRHKDIIPWDDDIDVMMPRPDYDRFRIIAGKELGDNFELGHYETIKNYYYPFMKVYDKTSTLIEQKEPFLVGGLFVDVFPLDGTSNSHIMDNFNFMVFKFIHYLSQPFSEMHYQKNKHKLSFRIANMIKKIFSKQRNKMFAFSEYWLRRNKVKESNILRMHYSMWGKKESGRKNLFIKSIKVPFGDLMASIPIGYDEYLTNLYGNYMTPPPIEKRTTHHNQFYINLERRISLQEVQKLKT